MIDGGYELPWYVLVTLLRALPQQAVYWIFGFFSTPVLWVFFCLIAGWVAGMVALAGDRLLGLRGLARRWVWLIAIATTVLLPAGLYFLPAIIHPGRYLPHPHSVLELGQFYDGYNPGTIETVNLETASLPGVREGPQPFFLDGIPGYNRVVIGLDNRLGSITPRAALLDRAAVWGWAGASAVALGVILSGFVALSRRRRRGHLAMVAGVPVVVADGLGPAVVGVRRQWIVLPHWALTMDLALRRQMLLHEGQHIRAGDPYLLLVAALALVLMPWNPALWWQIRRMRLAIEIDCDARVLRATNDPRSYGALLLEVGRRVSSRPLLAAPLAQPFSLLEGRIRAMGRRFTPRLGLRTFLTLLLAGAAVLFARELGTPPHRWPYSAEHLPLESTTRNAEFQLRVRTLATRLLQEWSVTMPELRSYLRREHPEIYRCGSYLKIRKEETWDLAITAADGGRLLAMRATPADSTRRAMFEFGTDFLPPVAPGREHLPGVLRELTGWNVVPLVGVVSPCIRTFEYRVVTGPEIAMADTP